MTLPPNAPSALVQLLFRPITTAAAATHVADLPPLPLLLQGEERRTPSSKTALPNPSRSSHLAKCGFVTFPSLSSLAPIITNPVTTAARTSSHRYCTTKTTTNNPEKEILPIPTCPRYFSCLLRRTIMALRRFIRRTRQPTLTPSNNRNRNPNTSTDDHTASVPPSLPSTPLARAASPCQLRSPRRRLILLRRNLHQLLRHPITQHCLSGRIRRTAATTITTCTRIR
mmetsp:Transcript_18806/g.39476  ORF Transcript_18806/g.39476 Transcript_18806/m.39476 type:complete len:227 (+) Transcript_18806:932-1612(+)